MQRLLAISAASAATALGCGPSKDKGYAVVDPMPMPPRPCFEPSQKIVAAANWSEGDGSPFVRVRLEIAQGVEDLSFEGADARVHVTRGVLVDKRSTAKELVVEVAPGTPDEELVGFSLAGATCADGSQRGTIDVSVRLLGGARPTTPGARLPVDLSATTD